MNTKTTPMKFGKERQNIRLSKSTGTIDWDSKHLKTVKRLIKEYHLEIQNKKCCYCRKSFQGEFSLVIDVEHILPKSQFPQYTLKTINLSVACKKCNMNIKKDNIDFIDKEIANYFGIFTSAAYKIIHPNIDNYYEHIKVICATVDDATYTIYTAKTLKGKYTYNYFRLQEIEIDELTIAQGGTSALESPISQLSIAIPERA